MRKTRLQEIRVSRFASAAPNSTPPCRPHISLELRTHIGADQAIRGSVLIPHRESRGALEERGLFDDLVRAHARPSHPTRGRGPKATTPATHRDHGDFRNGRGTAVPCWNCACDQETYHSRDGLRRCARKTDAQRLGPLLVRVRVLNHRKPSTNNKQAETFRIFLRIAAHMFSADLTTRRWLRIPWLIRTDRKAKRVDLSGTPR